MFKEFLRLLQLKIREVEARSDLDAGVRSLNQRRGDWQVQVSIDRFDPYEAGTVTVAFKTFVCSGGCLQAHKAPLDVSWLTNGSRGAPGRFEVILPSANSSHR